MKRSMTVPFSYLLVLAFAWAVAFQIPTAEAAPTVTVKCITDITKGVEGNPQSELYRGKCLEFVPYVKGTVTEDGVLAMPTAEAPYDITPGKTYALRFNRAGSMDIRGKKVPVYKVTYKDRDLCASDVYDPLGVVLATSAQPPSGVAVLVPGYWDRKGTWSTSIQETGGKTTPVFTASCVSGVVAKCAYWGYVPGQELNGEKLDRYHHACVYAARAMYQAGKSDSYTCSGTEIDIYDRLGIQKRAGSEFKFESTWTENGLKCLSRPRYLHCESDLAGPLASSSAQPCEEPVKVEGGEWPSSYDKEVLIAIGSKTDNDAESCPKHRDSARCPPKG